MPFITEEIYHALREQQDDLCVKQYEKVPAPDQSILQQGKLLQDVITGLRDARNKNQLKPREAVKLNIHALDKKQYQTIEQILSRQCNAKEIAFVSEPVANTIAVVIGKDKFYIEAEKPVDTGLQKEELMKELAYLRGFLESVTKNSAMSDLYKTRNLKW